MMENRSLRYQTKSLVEKLQGLEGAHLKALDEEKGWYLINVKPFSVKYVTDLIGVHLGSGNYEIKYDAPTVTWNIGFNIFGKGRVTI